MTLYHGTLADITMLTFMKGDTAVGYYTNAEKAVGVLKMLVEAFARRKFLESGKRGTDDR